MSLNVIRTKLFESLKKEMSNDDNKEFIENDILRPLIYKILDQIYPYFMWTGLFFMSMFVFIMIILLLNIRVFMYT